MITNQDKPSTNTPETHLNIGSGFNLLVGGIYKLIIGAAVLGGMTNTNKVSIGETWATVTYTWATETRSWLAVSQLLTNPAKPSTSIVNQAKP
jgi:hypothetical protein